MHSVSFPARLTRRFAAGSVALAAVLAGVGFAASPAHASTTGYCLRAVQAEDFGQIVQYQCDDSDNLQNWTVTQAAVPNGDTPPPNAGAILFQFQNNSASSYCLDADAQKIQDFGPIISWQCNSSDPYQLWMPISTGTALTFENYGAWLYHGGASYCLDADAQQVQDFGPVIQWQCDSSDPFQRWAPVASDHDVLQNIGSLI